MDGSMNGSPIIDQRRHKRAIFAYPVELKILFKSGDLLNFSGYMENVSEGGAGLIFEDRYGRIDLGQLSKAKIKLSFVMPHGEKVTIISSPRWMRKDVPERFYIKMGVEFENPAEWQLNAVKKLIKLKKKDHNMMWSLWEQFEKNLNVRG